MFTLNDLISDYFIQNISCLYYDIIGNILYSSDSYTRQRIFRNSYEFILSDELYNITGIYKLTFRENNLVDDDYVDVLSELLDEHHLLDSCPYFNIDKIEDLCLYGNLEMLIHYGVSYVETNPDFLNSKFSLYLLDGESGYFYKNQDLLSEFNLNILFLTKIHNLDFDNLLSCLPFGVHLTINAEYLKEFISNLTYSYSHNLFLSDILSFLLNNCDLSVCNHFKNVYLYYHNFSLYLYRVTYPSYETLIDLISSLNSCHIENFKFLYLSDYKDISESDAPDYIKSMLIPYLFILSELGLDY